MEISFEDWGLIDYGSAWKKQQELFEKALKKKAAGETVSNCIIFCEHLPVITLGRNADPSHVLFSEEQLSKKNISLYKTDRGGEVTYHGPGQVVVYPVIDLSAFGLGLKKYIFLLEEIVITLLKKRYRLEVTHLSGAAGVWLDPHIPELTRKICAVGVRASRYVTMHGIALNVNTDLSPFSFIHPCGFTDKGITSIEKELEEEQDLQQCKIWLQEEFKSVFAERKC
ncbi:MAG: lipoyl(octanoyl) transferase LipB [Candidatus Azobacteroides sp.]|nr:lipoyl(octanoyl) transferase LipB [Candidatus Azobacteroides sp.]